MGGGGQRGRQQDSAADGEAFLVSGGEHSRQAPGIYALRRRNGPVSRNLRSSRGARLRRIYLVIAGTTGVEGLAVARLDARRRWLKLEARDQNRPRQFM